MAARDVREAAGWAGPEGTGPLLALASTFTAQSLEPVLGLWGRTLGIGWRTAVAPYDQVFQQLLDPASLLGANQHGADLLLVRPEDWVRHHRAGGTATGWDARELRARAGEPAPAVRTAAARLRVPLLVALGPPSPAAQATLGPELDDLGAGLADDLAAVTGVAVGGTSLEAVELVSRLQQEVAAQASVTDLFECPTVAEMCGKLDGGAGGPQPGQAGRARGEDRRTRLLARQRR